MSLEEFLRRLKRFVSWNVPEVARGWDGCQGALSQCLRAVHYVTLPFLLSQELPFPAMPEKSPHPPKKKKKKKEKCSFNPSFVLILGIFRTVGGLGELLWDRDTGLCHLLLKVTLFHPCSLLRMGEKSKLNSWRRGERSQVNVELLERAGVTSGVK